MSNDDWGQIPSPSPSAQDAPPQADSKTQEEQKDFAAQAKTEELEARRTDRTERVKYAERVFSLICVWLGGVALILLLAGFGGAFGWFRLNDAVLIALVAGTSINIIGTFAIVMNYLFRKNAGTTTDLGTDNPPRKVVDKKIKAG